MIIRKRIVSVLAGVTLTTLLFGCNSGAPSAQSPQTKMAQSESGIHDKFTKNLQITDNKDLTYLDLNYAPVRVAKVINIDQIPYFADSGSDFNGILFPIYGFDNLKEPLYAKMVINPNQVKSLLFNVIGDLPKDEQDAALQYLNTMAAQWSSSQPKTSKEYKYCQNAKETCILELLKEEKAGEPRVPLLHEFLSRLFTAKTLRVSAAAWGNDQLLNERLWFLPAFEAIAAMNGKEHYVFKKLSKTIPVTNYSVVNLEQAVKELDSLSSNHVDPKKIVSQITTLKQKLNVTAKTKYKNLLDIPHAKTQCTTCTTHPIVIGDVDGSFGRTTLAAIQAGAVELDATRLQQLAEILNIEANVPTITQTDLRPFQENQEVSDKSDAIINYLVTNDKFYIPGKPVTFLGDIIWDRFSCNMIAMKTLIEKLHGNGVVFILGNHDDLEQSKIITPFQAGKFAKKPITDAQSMELQKLFVNGVYDPASQTFMNHAGVDEVGSSMKFGVGVVSPYKDLSIDAIVTTLNRLPIIDARFTDFRPSDAEMSRLAYFNSGFGKGITIVHGHTGNSNLTNPKVINLNAVDGGAYATTSVAIIDPKN